MKVKKRSLFLFVSLAALIMVYFTNCAGNLEMSNSLNTLCISQDCYSSSDSKLALEVKESMFVEEYDFNQVALPLPMVTTVRAYNQAVQSGATTFDAYFPMCMVDVGGACNDGGFADNIVEWELTDANQSCSLKSKWAETGLYRHYTTENLVEFFKLNGKCENGYFNVKVVYPCYITGQPQLSASGGQLLAQQFGDFWKGPRSLRLKIIGIDEAGKKYDNSKAQHESITFNLPGQASSFEKCPQ